MSYTNPWYFQGKTIDSEDIDEYEGFVYLITNMTTGQKYVGKKTFWTRRKQKNGRRKTLESDWKNYYGSHVGLKADVKEYGKGNFKREILHLCRYKKAMSYLEMKEQFVRDVLYSGGYYNDNIAGKYFKTESRFFD